MPNPVYIVAVIVVLLAQLPLLVPPPFGLTDHLVFWKAGQLVLNGASPYDTQAWADAQRTYDSAHLGPFIEASRPVWVYPAWTAVLFVPFGALPYPAGPWALHISYLAVGILSAALLVRSLPSRWRGGAGLALVLTAGFQPFIICARYGQFGSFLLLGAVLLFIGLQERRVLALLVAALLLSTKPQLFVVLAPLVVWLLVKRHAWREIALLSAALVSVAVLTTLRYPESVSFFRGGADERLGVYFSWYSTVWALALRLAGGAWPVLAAALIAAVSLTTVAAVQRLPKDLRLLGMIAGACVLSLSVTPVAFHYDHVPLVLAIVVAIAVARRPYQVALTVVVATGVPWLAFFAALSVGGPDSQSLSGVVPLLFGPLLLLCAWHRPRSEVARVAHGGRSPLRSPG